MRQEFKYAILLGLLCVGHLALSQDLPKVLPVSPEAAALFRYQDYPVDYSTGVPQISIPLYEIKSGSISLPITMNYHSSGRRINDETGALGLGWTLNAGGMISRTVYGDPDDNDAVIKFPTSWKKRVDINPQTDIQFLAGIDNDNNGNIPLYDTEYDLFTYMTSSISGKFFLRDIANVKSPVLIPKKPYKIEVHQITLSPTVKQFDYITITDDQGTKYKFGQDNETSHTSGAGFTAITSWLLNSITSADQSNVIEFHYSNFIKQRKSISQKTVITDEWKNCSCDNGFDPDPSQPSEYLTETEDIIDETYTTKRLTEITFRGGRILFDLISSSDVVNKMRVLNEKNEIIKIVEFTQAALDSRSDGNTPVKKLVSVNFKTMTDQIDKSYSFEYFPTFYPSGTSVVNSRFVDFWGFYNGSGQTNMRPYLTNIPLAAFVPTTIAIGNSSASRDPYLAAMKSGVLKKITYPTGGTVEFVYELNKYQDPATEQVQFGGGLRLYQSIATEGISNILKTYKYGIDESGFGKLALIPDPTYMFYTNYNIKYCSGAVTAEDLSYRTRTYFADIVPLYSYFAQQPIIYPEIVEYFGTPIINTGKIKYKYDFDPEIAPKGIANLFLGKEYKYWNTSSLIDQTEFKNVDGVYTPVKNRHNVYLETKYEAEKLFGLHVQKIYLTTPTNVTDAPGGSGLSIPSYKFAAIRQSGCGHVPTGPYPVFDYGDYVISVGKKELSSTEETIFSSTGDLVTTTNYTYNSNHLVSSSAVIDSKNNSIRTDIKYPFDYTGNSILSTMVNQNMLNFPVEEIKNNNSSHVQSTRTNYLNFSSSLVKIYASSIETKLGSSSYSTIIRYKRYDEYGNFLTLGKENDVDLSYQWGYNSVYPVVEVVNAATMQEVYQDDVYSATLALTTGFNEASTSLSTYSGTIILSLDAHPGKTYSLEYSLVGPEIKSGTLCISSSSTACQSNHYSTVTFNNMPAGNYTLYIYYYGSDPDIVRRVSYTYPRRQLLTPATQEFFYEGFEENGNGTSTPFAGEKYFTGDYTVPFTVPNARSYKANYRYLDAGVWKSITKPFTNNMTLTEGSAIDEVRVYPVNALMNTYTYKPLVGVTSHIDPSGKATLYEYDGFARLKTILDQDRNVLKTYDYRYQQNINQ